jgi:hypothetical protein
MARAGQLVRIEDISDFVAGQRAHASARGYDRLITPHEEVYPVPIPTSPAGWVAAPCSQGNSADAPRALSPG